MKKLLFVIPSLAGGGAERVLVYILENINRNLFRLYLAVFKREGELLESIPQDVKIITLKGKRNLYGFQWIVIFRLAMLLRKLRPDMVISFMWYPNLVATMAKLLSGFRGRLILSERVSLSFSFGPVGDLLRKIAFRYLYRFSDTIIVNSRKMAKEIEDRYPFLQNKLKLIYNPVDLQRVRSMGKEKVEHPWFNEDIPVIVGVGRLVSQKGFDYLIKAICILKDRNVNCRLMIIGKGEEEKKLKDLAKNLNISERVSFAGFQKNPYKYMARANVFVLSSLSEGFPNVLLEAMALGVPSVATRCLTGPEELVTDGANGILVPPADEQALAEAIERLILDEPLRKRLSSSAKKRAEDFEVMKIVKMFEKALNDEQ